MNSVEWKNENFTLSEVNEIYFGVKSMIVISMDTLTL